MDSIDRKKIDRDMYIMNSKNKPMIGGVNMDIVKEKKTGKS